MELLFRSISKSFVTVALLGLACLAFSAGCNSDGGGVAPTVGDESNLPSAPVGRSAGGEGSSGASMEEPVGVN
jgi:hypothetical protein